MRADVINRFIDAETGQVYLPGSEVDMDKGRVERLERKNCVRRKAHTSSPVQEESAPTVRRGRGRKKKAAE